RVAVAMQRDITFHVHQAFVQSVDLGDPDRQWVQMGLLQDKQLARHGPDMFLVGRDDPVATLPRLLIQVGPTGEGAARQEVVLDEPEVSLYAGGTIGVAALMCHEAEAETFGKS